MKSKSKKFSFALMKEGMKQVKAIALVFLFLAVVLVGLMTMSMNSNDMVPHLVDFKSFSMPIILIMAMSSFLMVFNLFGSVMTKRNVSDFYTSVPLNRSCVYLSYTASLVAWSTITSAAAILLAYFANFFVQSGSVPFLFVVKTVEATFVTNLLIIGLALVAMGVSGRIFSAVASFVLLMLAPRFILLILAMSVNAVAPMISIDSIPFIAPHLNILFGFTIGGNDRLNIFHDSTAFVSTSTLVYSLCLGIVYVVAGYFIHKARPAENTGKAMTFTWAKAVIRTLLAFVPLLMLFYTMADNVIIYPMFVVVVVVVSLLLYFGYELAVVRSFKKAVRALPMYLIVVALGGVFLLCGNVIGSHYLYGRIDSNEVEYIQIQERDYYSNHENWAAYYSSKLKHTDKKLIELVTKQYNDGAEYISSITSARGMYTYPTSYVTFHLKNGTDLQRGVVVESYDSIDTENKDDTYISNKLTEDWETNTQYNAVPKSSDLDLVVVQHESDAHGRAYVDTDGKIWDSYVEENVAYQEEIKKIFAEAEKYKDDEEDIPEDEEPTEDIYEGYTFVLYGDKYDGLNVVRYDTSTLPEKYFPKTTQLVKNQAKQVTNS